MSYIKKKCKVSVVMAIYNCALTLREAIDSILAQTFVDWELILCDDGSTDDTSAIASEYAMKYDNILLLQNNQNQGLAASLNTCIKYADGEYIARMDGDDISLPTRFEKEVIFLDAHPEYAVVGGGVILYDEGGDRNTLLNEEIPDVHVMKHGVPFFHPTIVMRKSVYDDLCGYVVSKRTRRGQDMDLWFRFFAKGHKGYNLQEPVLKYHDDLGDYGKKSSWPLAWGSTRTLWLGFKLNHFRWYEYVWALAPLAKECLPKRLIYRMHKMRTR